MSNIEALSACVTKLSPGDQAFAASLLSQSKRRPLSPKQLYWVDELVDRASRPEPEKKAVGDMEGVIALFDRAAKKLAFPAIVLSIEGVGEVRINVAGERARVPGSLNVIRFSDREWLGRVHRDGQFERSRKHEATDELIAGLKAFSQDPAGVAAAHGLLTGRCCFCNTGLTDARSTAAGFGPTCAKNYGLYEEWKKASQNH